MADTFIRSGLGYTMEFVNEQVCFSIDRIRRSRDGLTAELLVQTTIPTFGPHIHWARLNLSSTTARSTFAKHCAKRTNGANIDWDGLLEAVCRKVAVAERQGQPFTTVGRKPANTANPWLIKDFLYDNEVTTVYGDGGAGKSRIALAALLSVQTGEMFIPGFEPTKTGPCLYLDWESNEDRLDARVKALCWGMGMEEPIELAYRSCVEPLQDQVEDVSRYCQSEGIVAVVIDSVEMSMAGTKDAGGDANDAVVKLYAALRMIGVSAILVDHVAKNGGDSNTPRKAYGSIFKGNLARMAFELKQATGAVEQDGVLHLGLFHAKRNDDGKLMKPKGIKVCFNDSMTAYELEALQADLALKPTLIQAVAEILKHGPMKWQDIAEMLPEGKKDSVRVTCYQQAKAGFLINKDGKFGVKTDRIENM